MKKVDKELLFKALYTMLPYGVKVLHREMTVELCVLDKCDEFQVQGYSDWFDMESTPIKPYLRPMSDMTDEEFEALKEYSGLKYNQLELANWGDNKTLEFYLNEIPHYVVILVFDWLNKYHFDYRGLIEKGLALEAPADMYSTE